MSKTMKAFNEMRIETAHGIVRVEEDRLNGIVVRIMPHTNNAILDRKVWLALPMSDKEIFICPFEDVVKAVQRMREPGHDR